MVKQHCSPIIVAHMPKGQVSQLSAKEWYEWMYVLSGCVTLTNWARAILVFIPSKTIGTYRFITAKRPAQSGWIEPEYYFAHSKQNVEINGDDFEIIQWVPATESQISDAQPPIKEKKIHITSSLLLSKMSPLTEYSRDSFRLWCSESFNIGSDKADTFLRTLVHEG
jgi:hypothetical protein